MRGNPEELYGDLLASDEDEREKQNRLYRTVGVTQNGPMQGPPAPDPKPSLIQRLLSGVYIPPAPLGPNQRDIGGRYFLHGLMQAIAANHGGGGALLTGSRRTNGGYGSGAITPYQQQQLALARERLDFDKSKPNDITAYQQAGLDLRKQGMEDLAGYRAGMAEDRDAFHRDLQQERATDNARIAAHERFMEGIAGAGLGLRRNADARAAARAGRQQALASIYDKLPDLMKFNMAQEKQQNFAQFQQDKDPDALEMRNDMTEQKYLDEYYKLSNPFQNKYAGPPVQTGHSTTAVPKPKKGVKAAAPKAGKSTLDLLNE